LRIDDRFIAKEVSRLELDALTKFAPSYFEYMKQSIQHNVSLGIFVRTSLVLSAFPFLQRPTALAKIYGCFKIGYNNTTTGKAMRMNVVIMENLFYERRFDRVRRCLTKSW
jgi:1-phosphatidylinositol-3-phosphate 5-kinase